MRQTLALTATALLLGIALSLVATARAEAACMDVEACSADGEWGLAAANDAGNKSRWFQEMSRQDFVNAKQYGDMATFAFHAGKAVDAQWLKAMADEYSRRSRANAQAANEWGLRALQYAQIADDGFRRYAFFADLEDLDVTGSAAAHSDQVKAQIKKIGTGIYKKAKVICASPWKGPWGWVACQAVKSVVAGGVKRFIWRLNGRDCIRQRTRYDINPSTGYVIRSYHECAKFG